MDHSVQLPLWISASVPSASRKISMVSLAWSRSSHREDLAIFRALRILSLHLRFSVSLPDISQVAFSLSFPNLPGRVEISDLSAWLNRSHVLCPMGFVHPWKLQEIYEGQVAFDQSTSHNGFDPSVGYPLESLLFTVQRHIYTEIWNASTWSTTIFLLQAHLFTCRICFHRN